MQNGQIIVSDKEQADATISVSMYNVDNAVLLPFLRSAMVSSEA